TFREPVASCRFNPDNTVLASAHWDGARLWDSRSGRQLGYLPMTDCRAVAFSRDGGHFLAGCTRGLQCWAAERDSGSHLIRRLVYERGLLRDESIDALEMDGSGSRVLALSRGDVRVIEIQTGTETANLQFERYNTLYKVSWSP